MRGVFFVLLACMLWAIDTLIRYPLLWSGTTAERIVVTEHFFLFLVFLPFVLKNIRRFLGMRLIDLFYFAFIGGIGSALATLVFTKAFFLINPSLVILLQKLQPVVAIILARIILSEPIRKQFVVWAFVCLVGGLLISAEDIFKDGIEILFKSATFDMKSLEGYGYALIAVAAWGSATVFGKKLSLLGFKESELLAGRFVLGAFFLFPLANISMLQVVGSEILLGKIALMACISGLVAMYFYYQGLKRISARLCSLAEMFFPFFAVIVNWFVLGESLTTLQIVGGSLLLLGSTVIQLRRY